MKKTLLIFPLLLLSFFLFSVSCSGSEPATTAPTCPYNLTDPFAADYILPGASDLGDGTYLFSVWAPNATRVNLAGTINDWDLNATQLEFDSSSGYWWGVHDATNGDMYKFVLDREDWVGDPYAKAFNASDNDNPIIVDLSTYTWGDSAWAAPSKNQLIIYETHIDDMTRTDTSIASGIRGTFAGFIEKIPYLTRLGVNAVELMPIQEWPGEWYSWGYNNCGFFAPENSLSTNGDTSSTVDEFKAVVDALHQAGIAVILDVVYNHSSSDNNYLWLIDSDYYFEGDTDWGNRLDFTQDMVQKFFLDNLKFWMDEYHVDGFRFDSTENIDIDPYLIDIIDDLRAGGYDDKYYIFEEFNGTHNGAIQSYNTAEGESAISSWGTGYKNSVWAAIAAGSDQLGTITYYSHDSGYQYTASPLNYFSSHDEGTLNATHSASIGEVRAAAAHLLTSMGTPMIWMGDEFMRTHYGNYPPTGDGIDEANNNITWSKTNTYSTLIDYYSALISLRKNHTALQGSISDPAGSGNFTWCHNGWGTMTHMGYAYSGYSGDNDFIVLVNYGASDLAFNSVTVPSSGDWYVMISNDVVATNNTDIGTWSLTSGATNFTVDAASALILMSDSVNP